MSKKKRKKDQVDQPGDEGMEVLVTEPQSADATEDSPATDSERAETPVDELTELRNKVEELNDKHLRAVAELQNFRRRAATEREESIRYASTGLIRSLLSVVDDLERSMASVDDAEKSSSLASGVRLVHENLMKALMASHVERIEAVGKPFDPQLHEAMMQQPSDEAEPGTVLEEFEPGYRLWDRVVRPARVVVAKAVEDVGEDAE